MDMTQPSDSPCNLPRKVQVYYEMSDSSSGSSSDIQPVDLDTPAGGYIGYTTQGETFFQQYKSEHLAPIPEELGTHGGGGGVIEPEELNEDTAVDIVWSTTSSDSDSRYAGNSNEGTLARSSPRTVKRILMDHLATQKSLVYLPKSFYDALREEEDKGFYKNNLYTHKILPFRTQSGLRMYSPRDWNEELQRLLPEGTFAAGLEAITKASELARDFVTCAETYARIIVDELGIPDQCKSIKPADVGGVAGGQKYIIHGILFKFCLDQQLQSGSVPIWMYGGSKPDDSLAMKMARQDLNGMDLWQLIPHSGLHFPLMALVDYKGFRLVATSLLPISKRTLIYGSNNCGRCVKASDPKFNAIMKQLGWVINLKPHRVGNQLVPLCAPGDVEGHRGKDGRYYLLDFARTLIPEAPEYRADGRRVNPRGVFSRMLRPEIVLSSSVPLSPDVFSGWGEKDTEKELSEQEVAAATQRIFSERIPALIQELMSYDTAGLEKIYSDDRTIKVTPRMVRDVLDDISFSTRMHSNGVNMRYMGRVRTQIRSELWKEFILSIAISRLVKDELRVRLRDALRTSRPSDTNSKHVVSEIFNGLFLFHCMPESPSEEMKDERTFFSSGKTLPEGLESKFPFILTEVEKTCTVREFLTRFSTRIVISELMRLGLVRFAPKVTRRLISRDLAAFQLVEGDIDELCTVTFTSHRIRICHAVAFQIQAKKLMRSRTRPLLLAELFRTGTMREKSAMWVYGLMPVGNAVQLSGMSHPVPQNSWWLAAGLSRWVKGLCAAPSTVEVNAHPTRSDYVIDEEPVAEPAELDKEHKSQARRLLHLAVQYITAGDLSSMVFLVHLLRWGDILADIADTHSQWAKISKCYEAACGKFRQVLSIVGPSKMLLVVWEETLRRYANAAERFGHREMAESLKEAADCKARDMPAVNRAVLRFIEECNGTMHL